MRLWRQIVCVGVWVGAAGSVAVDLPRGRDDLRVAFTNNLNTAGEDRHPYLDKVVFWRD